MNFSHVLYTCPFTIFLNTRTDFVAHPPCTFCACHANIPSTIHVTSYYYNTRVTWVAKTAGCERRWVMRGEGRKGGGEGVCGCGGDAVRWYGGRRVDSESRLDGREAKRGVDLRECARRAVQRVWGIDKRSSRENGPYAHGGHFVYYYFPSPPDGSLYDNHDDIALGRLVSAADERAKILPGDVRVPEEYQRFLYFFF